MEAITHAAERGTAVQASPSSTAAGAAALSAVFTLPVAVDAAVVYSGVQNVNVTLSVSQRHASNVSGGGDLVSTLLDLDGNAVNDFRLRVDQAYDYSSAFRMGIARLLGLGGNLVANDGSEARNFSESNMVGLGSGSSGVQVAILRQISASNGGSRSVGHFAPSQTGVAGVAFDIGGDTHFGWIRLLVEDGPGSFPYQVTAVDWAYEDRANTPVHVPNFQSEVPEANPGLVLLAAGGTGLAAWRLRRRKEAKQAAKV